MVTKLLSGVLFVAHLTHDHNIWTILLDVLVKLSSCHMLILFSVTDIASKLWAIELSVSLELSQRFPDDLSSAVNCMASVGEFAEVNTVLENFVDILHEVTPCLAVGAAHIKAWCSTLRCNSWSRSPSISTGRHHLMINLFHDSSKRSNLEILVVLIISCSLVQLDLAILAEEFIALGAFHWFVRELSAHNALNLLNHFPLEFVLDFIHLNVERWDWLRPHHLVDERL